MNTYGLKMAGVFMFSTSTILTRTRIVRRWIPFLGFALAIALLFGTGTIQWVPLVFPAWVFLISADILIQNVAGRIKATAEPPAPDPRLAPRETTPETSDEQR